MNALPGRMMVDVGAPESERAAQLQVLCQKLATDYYPRHAERAEALARQLLLTAWHMSGHAVERGDPSGASRTLFGLEPEHVRSVIQVLLRSVYRHDMQRFLAVSGTTEEALRRLPPEALLELAAMDDVLAASLAAEVYRLGGPLPWRRDNQACAEVWFARYCTVRGPDRDKLHPIRIRAFVSDADHLQGLMRKVG